MSTTPMHMGHKDVIRFAASGVLLVLCVARAQAQESSF